MRKSVKYGLIATGSLFAGLLSAMVVNDKERKKINETSKFRCEDCPYSEGMVCIENERILNVEEFISNVPAIVSECILKYYPTRILRPLCLVFLHYDWDKSRVVCYSYKQGKIMYININTDDVDDIKISVTAG